MFSLCNHLWSCNIGGLMNNPVVLLLPAAVYCSQHSGRHGNIKMLEMVCCHPHQSTPSQVLSPWHPHPGQLLLHLLCRPPHVSPLSTSSLVLLCSNLPSYWTSWGSLVGLVIGVGRPRILPRTMPPPPSEPVWLNKHFISCIYCIVQILLLKFQLWSRLEVAD